ncbi:hypothetical protein [Methylobacterium nodulans]|uniref:Uncharacterized protein n=1 Tax=Methylobacterium nodulans (strain LMG 21967 / CNCM I-2342 / ORS 2060) TaxID=460265 RepID=B8IC18_METNO|nr:hypothetical protein [Methylobacterium nodulans]ACL61200.1 hypothetical protein Mnod_6418 [Methylobacterium nodulans ORS 2060]
MRQTHLPVWWYRLRYTAEGHLALAVAIVVALLTAAVVGGVPEMLAAREEALKAACVKRGGHIEYERGTKGGIFPVCRHG